jgi:hypothetical protein
MTIATIQDPLPISNLRRVRMILHAKIARTLGADDPAEIDALAQEIETALARAGYHWRSSLAKRARRNRRTGRRVGATPTGTRISGRPSGAQNFAARQLGLELAVIWFERTGRPPTRYESNLRSHETSFTEFVAAIAGMMPLMFRKASPSPMLGVEYLVRTSIADFRAAKAAPEEYRRRGLIDEQLWLGSKTNHKP